MIRELCLSLPSALIVTSLVAGCATAPAKTPAQAASKLSPPDAATLSAHLPARYQGATIYHVTYAFTVGPEGRPHQAEMVNSASPARLVLSAHQALLGSTFEPCTTDTAGSCKQTYTFRFIVPKVHISAQSP